MFEQAELSIGTIFHNHSDFEKLYDSIERLLDAKRDLQRAVKYLGSTDVVRNGEAGWDVDANQLRKGPSPPRDIVIGILHVKRLNEIRNHAGSNSASYCSEMASERPPAGWFHDLKQGYCSAERGKINVSDAEDHSFIESDELMSLSDNDGDADRPEEGDSSDDLLELFSANPPSSPCEEKGEGGVMEEDDGEEPIRTRRRSSRLSEGQ